MLCSIFPPVSGFVDIGFAALGAMTYKAVNTMDSMFGYKNDRYLEFGWTAAKLDDIANFIPARLSGLMVIFSACILQLDWKGSAKIFLGTDFNTAVRIPPIQRQLLPERLVSSWAGILNISAS